MISDGRSPRRTRFCTVRSDTAEPGGDLLRRSALAGQLAERHDLVRRVHGDAHGVLGERGLGGGIAVDQQARDGEVRREVLLRGQRLQRAQAARSGGDAVLGLAAGHDDEVLQEAVGLDRGCEFGVGPDPGGVGGRGAHVALVDAQLVEGDQPRLRGGGGCGCLLHGCLLGCKADGSDTVDATGGGRVKVGAPAPPRQGLGLYAARRPGARVAASRSLARVGGRVARQPERGARWRRALSRVRRRCRRRPTRRSGARRACAGRRRPGGPTRARCRSGGRSPR